MNEELCICIACGSTSGFKAIPNRQGDYDFFCRACGEDDEAMASSYKEAFERLISIMTSEE